MPKYYGIRRLSERLADEGLPSTRIWIYKMIKKGKLTLPKHAFSNSRYAFTEDIISDIVNSLKTKGEWPIK